MYFQSILYSETEIISFSDMIIYGKIRLLVDDIQLYIKVENGRGNQFNLFWEMASAHVYINSTQSNRFTKIFKQKNPNSQKYCILFTSLQIFATRATQAWCARTLRFYIPPLKFFISYKSVHSLIVKRWTFIFFLDKSIFINSQDQFGPLIHFSYLLFVCNGS